MWGFPGETVAMTFENDTYTFKVSKNSRTIYETTAKLTVKNYGSLGFMKVASFEDGSRKFDVNACTRYMDEQGQPAFYDPQRTEFIVDLLS